MNKKLSILTILAICSSLAYAESVNFAGTVSTSCAFSNNTGGVLGVGAVGTNYHLAAGMGGIGNAASVDIAYSGDPTFTIDAVSSITSPGGAPTPSDIRTGVFFGQSANNNAAGTALAHDFGSGTKTFQLDHAYTTDTATIQMMARASSPWVTGSYSAQTTITCQ